MNRCKIDFLSFSASPTLLIRCREMAKQRFRVLQSSVVGSQLMFNDPETGVAHVNQIEAFTQNLAATYGGIDALDYHSRQDFQHALANVLDDSEIEVSPDCSFKQCYDELIRNIGIDMLDCLCYGEVESFVSLLNEEITYHGNVWTMQRRHGFSGYKYSAALLCNGAQCGLVAWGADNFGFYVSFSGKGCDALDMQQVHKALKQIPDAKITRLDIAFDDLEGVISIDDVIYQYQDGAFITRGKPPSYSYFESGSLRQVSSGTKSSTRVMYGVVPDKGRTFYVGQRQNGKLFRAYEKGKQLQSTEYPNWVRLEVQIGNRSRVIPFDALINPDAYFAGAYPALSTVLDDVPPIAIKTTRIAARTTYERAVETVRKQFGKYLNLMKIVNQSDEGFIAYDRIVESLTKGLLPHEIPDRLNYPVAAT